MNKTSMRIAVTAAAVTVVLVTWISSTAVAEEQREVTVCKRQWYCAWLCKKCTTETRWCYDFSSIHSSCRVVVEILHGCEQGKEYKWYAGCLGWYSACLTGRTLCFANRLTNTGACSTSVCSVPIP